MKTGFWVWLCLAVGMISFQYFGSSNKLDSYIQDQISELNHAQVQLLEFIENSDVNNPQVKEEIIKAIHAARKQLKKCDPWLRYLNPVAYHSVNGPLPVEWETEVFEKHEAPYRREGAGLSLAEMYLSEDSCDADLLSNLVQKSIDALGIYRADSTRKQLEKPSAAFYTQRLLLLNLATIYTTGFENPEKENVIPELNILLKSNRNVMEVMQLTYPDLYFPADYILLYDSMTEWTQR